MVLLVLLGCTVVMVVVVIVVVAMVVEALSFIPCSWKSEPASFTRSLS